MFGHENNRHVAWLLTSLLVLAISQRLYAAVTLRPVVWSNDILLNGEIVIGIPDRHMPLINNNGRVAFGARIEGDDGAQRRAIIVERTTGLEIIAADGDPAPGAGPDSVFSSTSHPLVWNDADQAFFKGTLRDPVSGRSMEGLWVTEQGTLNAVAIEGQQAPGTPEGVWFDSLRPTGDWLVLNEAGQAVFTARLRGPGINSNNERGLWRYSNGSVQLVARNGIEVPGVGPGVPSRYGVTLWPSIDAGGDVCLRVCFSESAGLPAEACKVLRGQPGALVPVLSPGDALPDAEPGQEFLGADEFVIGNRSGDFVFEGWLGGPGIDDSNRRGTYVKIGDSIHVAARMGGQVPGMPDGVVFSWFSFLPMMGNNGTAAFLARMSGPGIDGSNNSACWAFHQGATRLVAREGDPAPGAEPGAVFRYFDLPVANGLGQVAFTARLRGPGIDETNEWGLWLSEPNGELVEIARDGSPLDLGNGDLRTVQSVDIREYTGSGGGKPTSLNDHGELAFYVAFADGSRAILVASTIVDSDGDGLPDGEDACPNENPEGLDADGDGCVDRPEHLSQLIAEQSLPDGMENALIRFADNAAASLSRGRPNAARAQLGALLAFLRAQQGRHISDESALLLMRFTENAIAALP